MRQLRSLAKPTTLHGDPAGVHVDADRGERSPNPHATLAFTFRPNLKIILKYTLITFCFFDLISISQSSVIINKQDACLTILFVYIYSKLVQKN